MIEEVKYVADFNTKFSVEGVKEIENAIKQLSDNKSFTILTEKFANLSKNIDDSFKKVSRMIGSFSGNIKDVNLNTDNVGLKNLEGSFDHINDKIDELTKRLENSKDVQSLLESITSGISEMKDVVSETKTAINEVGTALSNVTTNATENVDRLISAIFELKKRLNEVKVDAGKVEKSVQSSSNSKSKNNTRSSKKQGGSSDVPKDTSDKTIKDLSKSEIDVITGKVRSLTAGFEQLIVICDKLGRSDTALFENMQKEVININSLFGDFINNVKDDEGNVKVTVDKLVDEISGANGRLKTMKSFVSSLKGLTLYSELDLDSKQTLDSNISILERNLESLKGKIADDKRVTDELKSSVDNSLTSLNNFKQEMLDGSISVEDMRNHLKELNSAYRSFKNDAKTAKDSTLFSELDLGSQQTLNSNISTLRSNLKTLKGDIANDKRVTDELKSSVDNSLISLDNFEKSMRNGSISVKDMRNHLNKLNSAYRSFKNDAKTAKGDKTNSFSDLNNEDQSKKRTEYQSVLKSINDLETNYRQKTAKGFNFENLDISKITEAKNKLEDLSEKFFKGGLSLNEYENELSGVKNEIANLNNEFISSSTVIAQGSNIYIDSIDKIKGAIASLEVKMEEYSAARVSNNKESRDAYTALESLKQRYNALEASINSGTMTEEEFNVEMGRINGAVKTQTAIIEKNDDAHRRFGQELKKFSRNLGTWFSGARLISAAIRTTKQMVTQVIELETSMTQLKIVTNATDTQMKEFASTASTIAKELGSSISGVMSSIETFTRLGYNLEESSTLAKYSTMLSNIANVEVEDATTGITSIIKGYQLQVDQSEHIADVLVKVGQSYAVSASEMMEAYEKSGAALSATGTDFEKSAGLIAAGNAAVQNASTVGTALKTISARIRNSKEDLEELGESTEDLANGFSKYAKTIKSVSGVDILKDGTTDTYKDLYTIFSEIANVWDDLNDTQQSVIANALGGQRQYQIIASIITNWKDAAGAYSDAMNAAGEATKANSLYMDTTTAKIGQFKAAYEELSMSMVDSDFLKSFIKDGIKLLEIIRSITEALSTFGGIKTILAEVIGMLTTFNSLRIAKTIEDWKKSFNKLKTAMNGVFKGLQTEALTTEQVLNAVFGWIGVIISAAGLVYGAVSGIVEKQKEAKKATEEAAEAYNETRKSLNELISSYSQLALDGIDTDELSEVENIQQSITDLVGKEATNLELVNDNLDKELAKLREIERQGASNSYSDVLTTYNNKKSDYDKLKWGTYDFYRLSGDGWWESTMKGSQFGGYYEYLNKEVSAISDAIEQLKDVDENLASTFSGTGDNYNRLKEILYSKTPQESLEYLEELNSLMIKYKSVWYNSIDNPDEALGGLEDAIETYHSVMEDAQEAAISLLDSEATIVFADNFDKSITNTAEGIDYYVNSCTEAIKTDEQLNEALESGLITENDIKLTFYELAKTYIPEYKDQIDESITSLTEQLSAEESINDVLKVRTETYDELADSYKAIKGAYDIINTAEKENVSATGLSQSTIDSLKDLSEDYIDYLYEENGVLKLNTEAWKQRATATVENNINKIKNNIKELEAQRVGLKGITTQEYFIGPPSDASLTEEEYTKAVEENTKQIEKNRKALDLYEAVYNSMEKSLSDVSKQYGVLKKAMDDTKTAKNKLDKALSEDEYDTGYEERVEAFRSFEETMEKNEFGSRAYKAYSEYFGLLEKNEADVMSWTKANAKYFEEGERGIKNWLDTVEKLSESGKLDGIASYDSNTGYFWYDINKLDEFADKLGWTTEMTEDFIQKYKMYSSVWTDRTPSETFTELLNANVIEKSGDRYVATLEDMKKYTGMTEEEINQLISTIDTYVKETKQASGVTLEGLGIDKENEGIVTVDLQFEYDDSLVNAAVETTVDKLESLVGKHWEFILSADNTDAESKILAINNLLSGLDDDTNVVVTVDDNGAKKKLNTTIKNIRKSVGKKPVKIKTEADVEGAESDISNVSLMLDDVDGTIAEVEITGEFDQVYNSISGIIGLLQELNTLKNQQVLIDFKGVSSGGSRGGEAFANGTKKAKEGLALLGDEYSADGSPKPELVISDGYAYIAGENGPTLGYLRDGDQVLTADETKKALKGTSVSTIPAHAGGTGGGINRGYKSSNTDLGVIEKLQKEINDWKHSVEMGEKTRDEYYYWLQIAYQTAYYESNADISEFYEYIEEVRKGQEEIANDQINDFKFMIDKLQKNGSSNNDLRSEYQSDLNYVDYLITYFKSKGYKEDDDFLQSLYNTKWELEESQRSLIDDDINDLTFKVELMTRNGVKATPITSKYNEAISKINAEISNLYAKGYNDDSDLVQEYYKKLWEIKDARAELAKNEAEKEMNAVQSLISVNEEKGKNNYSNYISMMNYWINEARRLMSEDGKTKDSPEVLSAYGNAAENQKLAYTTNIDKQIGVYEAGVSNRDELGINNKEYYDKLAYLWELRKKVLLNLGYDKSSKDVLEAIKNKNEYDRLAEVANEDQDIKYYENLASQNESKGISNTSVYATLSNRYATKAAKLVKKGYSADSDAVMSAKQNSIDYKIKAVEETYDSAISDIESSIAKNETLDKSNEANYSKLASYYDKEIVNLVNAGVNKNSKTIKDLSQKSLESSVKSVQEKYDTEINKLNNSVSKNEAAGKSNEKNYQKLSKEYNSLADDLVSKGLSENSDQVANARQQSTEYSIKAVTEAHDKEIGKLNASIAKNESKGKSNESNYKKLSKEYGELADDLIAKGLSKNSDDVVSAQQQALDYAIKSVDEKYDKSIGKINSSISRNEILGYSNDGNYKKLAKEYEKKAEDLIASGVDANADSVIEATNNALDNAVKATNEKFDRAIEKLDAKIAKNEGRGKSNKTNYETRIKKLKEKRAEYIADGLTPNSKTIKDLDKEIAEAEEDAIISNLKFNINKRENGIELAVAKGKTVVQRNMDLSNDYLELYNTLISKGYAADSDEAVAAYNGYVNAKKAVTEERIRKLEADISNIESNHGSNNSIKKKLEKELEFLEADLAGETNFLSESYQNTLSQINSIKDRIHDLKNDTVDDKIFKIEELQRDGLKDYKAIEKYSDTLKDVKNLIKEAKKEGYTDNDDYMQDLIDQANTLEDTIKDLIDGIKDSAKDAFDEILDYQLDMNKQAYNDTKDKLQKQLDSLKDFYDEQKKMLDDRRDEDTYLEESAEKAKAVADVRAEIEQLKYDNSAWATKRRLELESQLADAEKEMNDFEDDHAYDMAIKLLEDNEEYQTKKIEDQIQSIEDILNDPHTLYNEALADIQKTSMKQLYYSMKEYNRKYGDGNDEAFDEKWKNLYGSLYDYEQYTGKTYKNTQTTKSTSAVKTVLSIGDTVTVKGVAKHFSSKSGGFELPKGVAGKSYLVGDVSGQQVLLKDKKGNMIGWIAKSNLEGYASGTDRATPGIHRIDENGSEYVFSSSNGSRYRVFSGGEKVLNAKATDFLYKFANGGDNIIYEAVKKAMDNGSLSAMNNKDIVTNISTGDIIINGNTDQATVSEIRRAQRENVQNILKEFNKLK